MRQGRRAALQESPAARGCAPRGPGCVRALGLFARVIDLQRQDRKPVNDQARRFGVQRALPDREGFVARARRSKLRSSSSARSLRSWLVGLHGVLPRPVGIRGAGSCAPRPQCAIGRSWPDAGARPASAMPDLCLLAGQQPGSRPRPGRFSAPKGAKRASAFRAGLQSSPQSASFKHPWRRRPPAQPPHL